ncbi:succinylglutamate desuccinylase [Betaproteobacteria bacterium GR16-43]|nr:succinylglutamate desuccinylase [Betaproteobacteria bacterium GR16-43]
MNFESIAYSGRAPGVRLIVTGAVHGNETCGTQGIRRVVAEIQSGALAIERGQVTFVPICNPLAYAKGERMGDRNLNRNLAPTSTPKDFEDHVANWLCPLMASHEALLDLHSTRGKTEAFALVGPHDNTGIIEPFKHAKAERDLAKRLGVKRFVEGWLDTYARGVARRRSNAAANPLAADAIYGVGTTEYMRSKGGYSMTLECGQHEDPQSPEVAYRAIRNALAHLRITADPAPPAVEKYEALRMHEVVDRDHEDDRFSRPWASFDALSPGDLIATRRDGTEIRAPSQGRILFPDVSAKPGHEWFYLAETIDSI